MKITTSQLRRIIKEEVTRVIREAAGQPTVDQVYDDALAAYEGVNLADFEDAGYSMDDLLRDPAFTAKYKVYPDDTVVRKSSRR